MGANAYQSALEASTESRTSFTWPRTLPAQSHSLTTSARTCSSMELLSTMTSTTPSPSMNLATSKASEKTLARPSPRFSLVQNSTASMTSAPSQLVSSSAWDAECRSSAELDAPLESVSGPGQLAQPWMTTRQPADARSAPPNSSSE